MEFAWIVSRDEEVEAVLACEDLHVRPVDERVRSEGRGALWASSSSASSV